MEIKNKLSDLNNKIQSLTTSKNYNSLFKNEIEEKLEKYNTNLDENFTFQKLKNMTPDEINKFYTNKAEATLLNTLKLSTMFSQNNSMNEAMFNIILSKGNLGDSQVFLYNMMNNRNSYLSNKNSDHGAWLRKSLIEQIDNPKIQNEQIEIEKQFQLTMLQFDVAQHIRDMMGFLKVGRDKNEDNSSLSFLYNNSYLQYQNLYNEYEFIEQKNSELLNQQLKMNSLNNLLL